VELEIEKKSYGLRIRIGNESYFIKDNGNWFVLEIENENGEVVDMTDDNYKNLGVKGFNELLCALIESPTDILEMLLGEKKDIEKVIVELS
jgi:hypothetical protein